MRVSKSGIVRIACLVAFMAVAVSLAACSSQGSISSSTTGSSATSTSSATSASSATPGSSSSGTATSGNPSDAGKIHVSVIVIGPDASGTDVSYVSLPGESFKVGESAREALEYALSGAGFEYDEHITDIGPFLAGITSFDGQTYSADASTGKSWQFYHNGKSSVDPLDQVILVDGDTIAWYYGVKGASLPSVGTGV